MSLPGIQLSKILNLLYLPITADTIHSITIWLTDQNGNELNLGEENEFVNAISSERDLKNILSIKKDTLYQCQNANIRGSKRQAQESI